jgi:hypothetical protein
MARVYYGYALKTGDTSRASTTAETDDPDLTKTLVSGKSYIVQVFLFANSASATPGFKYGYSYTGTLNTASTGMIFGTNAAVNVATGGNIFGVLDTNITAAQTRTATTSATANANVRIYAIYMITPTSNGTFSIKWAQATSNVTNTTLKAGSYFLVEESLPDTPAVITGGVGGAAPLTNLSTLF